MAARRTQTNFERFYQVCEILKGHKEEFLTQRPSLPLAARLLSEKVGFAVSVSTVKHAQQTTKVTWISKREKGSKAPQKNVGRILATALLRLYEQLGNDPPPSLVDLVRSYQGKPGEAPAVLPMTERREG